MIFVEIYINKELTELNKWIKNTVLTQIKLIN